MAASNTTLTKIQTWFIPECISPSLSGSDEDSIRELACILEKSGKVTDCSQVIQDILIREKTAEPFILNSIFIPHALSKGVSDFCAAAGIHKDADSLHIIIMVVWPENSRSNLKKIAALIRSLSKANILEGLKNAEDSKGISDYLNSLLPADAI